MSRGELNVFAITESVFVITFLYKNIFLTPFYLDDATHCSESQPFSPDLRAGEARDDVSLSEASGRLCERILAAKDNKGRRHLSLFKEREKVVVEYHFVTY